MKRTLLTIMSACILGACGADDTNDTNNDAGDVTADAGQDDGAAGGFCCQGNAYHECTDAQADATCGDLSACTAVPSKDRLCQGNTNQLPINASCSDSFDCRGGACAFDEGEGYCSVTCNSSSDCPPGWECEGGSNLVCTRP